MFVNVQRHGRALAQVIPGPSRDSADPVAATPAAVIGARDGGQLGVGRGHGANESSCQNSNFSFIFQQQFFKKQKKCMALRLVKRLAFFLAGSWDKKIVARFWRFQKVSGLFKYA